MFNALYLSNKGFDGDRYELFEIVRKARFCNLYTLFKYVLFAFPIEASHNLNMVILMNNIIKFRGLRVGTTSSKFQDFFSSLFFYFKVNAAKELLSDKILFWG